jgi:hypothetical protein
MSKINAMPGYIYNLQEILNGGQIQSIHNRYLTSLPFYEEKLNYNMPY